MAAYAALSAPSPTSPTISKTLTSYRLCGDSGARRRGVPGPGRAARVRLRAPRHGPGLRQPRGQRRCRRVVDSVVRGGRLRVLGRLDAPLPGGPEPVAPSPVVESSRAIFTGHVVAMCQATSVHLISARSGHAASSRAWKHYKRPPCVLVLHRRVTPTAQRHTDQDQSPLL